MTMKTSNFEVWKNAESEWQWRLRASNGKIIAAAEGYKCRSGAIAGVTACRRHARMAELALLG